jgi:tetratricopeptide (TPR) repeat protein
MHSSTHENNKLTLEKNSELLHEIRVKSDAAKILGKLSDGHREVFEMCARYLAVNGRELTRVNPGSPRLAALLKGKDIAENFHKFHLLQWAEIEARNLTSEARSRSKVSDKIESAQKALSVVDSALKFYPNELNLRDSVEALTEFIASIKMSDWIDRAERAEFKKNYKHAKKLYMDALFFLERDSVNLENRDLAAEKIRTEIERIENLQAEFRS